MTTAAHVATSSSSGRAPVPPPPPPAARLRFRCSALSCCYSSTPLSVWRPMTRLSSSSTRLLLPPSTFNAPSTGKPINRRRVGFHRAPRLVHSTRVKVVGEKKYAYGLFPAVIPRSSSYTEGEVTSQNLWSRYDRHCVAITRHNASS